MKSARFGVVAFVSALLLAGCGEEKKEEQAAAPAAEQPAQPATQEQTASTEQPAAAPAAAEPGSGGELNVYNWSDYIGETTVEDFQKETGITVRYDVYDSNETLDAKLMAGNTGYDIVVPTGSFLGRQIQAGIYQKIDKSKISNYGNIDPQILEALKPFDPSNEYAVPYFWGTVGIGVNVDKVKERLGENAPIDSFDLLFKPENAAKLQDCGIAMLDSPSDILPPALKYLGKDPHSKSEEDYAAVEQMLTAVRPYVKYFHSSQYINDLADGELCAVIGWSGDVFIAAGARRGSGQQGRTRLSHPEGRHPALGRFAGHPEGCQECRQRLEVHRLPQPAAGCGQWRQLCQLRQPEHRRRWSWSILRSRTTPPSIRRTR